MKIRPKKLYGCILTNKRENKEMTLVHTVCIELKINVIIRVTNSFLKFFFFFLFFFIVLHILIWS